MSVAQSVLALSSGTLAGLTGIKDYKALDEIQHKFCEFVVKYRTTKFMAKLA